MSNVLDRRLMRRVFRSWGLINANDRPAGGGTIYQSFTAPVLDNFTWANQGVGTAVESNDTIVMASAAATGRPALMEAIPAAPYTRTLIFQPMIWRQANADYVYGIILRKASTDERIYFAYANPNEASGSIRAKQFNAGVYARDITGLSAVAANLGDAPLVCLRIEDDNTNRKFLFSSNGGRTFRTMGSESRTQSFVPDQIGFGFMSTVNAGPYEMTTFSWGE